MRIEKKTPFVWPSEAALCAEFASLIPDGWTVYNEACGFDMVVVHDATGAQIGVEAKLALNAKVISQAIDGLGTNERGPDFRAVLVGGRIGDIDIIARRLGITVIRLREKMGRYRHFDWQGPERPSFAIHPDLPEAKVPDLRRFCNWFDHDKWFDLAPERRLALPDYVPDVEAGHPSPILLSDWKIKAIKVCVYVERRGEIDRAAFRALRIDPSRWMTGNWLRQAEVRGMWRPGPGFPAATYRRLHPSVYAQIEDDYETWAATIVAPKAKEVML